MTDGKRITVYGYHLDYFGHVNNCKYLEYLEDARWHCLGEGFAALGERGLSWVIVNININYRAPAFLGDELISSARIIGSGQRRVILEQKVVREKDQKILVDAEVTTVVVRDDTGEPVFLDDDLRQVLKIPAPAEVP